MRTVVAKVPYLTLNAEAAKMGRLWPDVTGLLVQQFEDGTSLIVVQPGVHPDAERFVAHLADVGMDDGA